MTTLIISEKPSQARNYAKALGGMSGIYKGTSYRIVPARGHLYEFAKPDAQVADDLVDKYKSWDISRLPWNAAEMSWKRVKQKDTAAVLKNIQDSAKGCDEIVLACDVDPSGEGGLIAIEIIDELGLAGGRRKFTRMYHMDESEAEVRRAFENRVVVPDLYKHDEFLKAWYRTRWDFLSMQWSRIATKCGDGKSVIRCGRLKSAMVKLVGDQLAAVANYEEIPYYQNRFRDENGVMYTDPNEPTFPKESDVPRSYHGSDVVCDSKTKKTTAPPKLLDLAALSSRLSSIPPKRLLSTYQKMYEDQILSYPRTEDKFITPEQFNELLPKVNAIADLVGADKSKLTHRAPRKTHVKPGGAHGANRPGTNVPRSLDDLAKYGAGAVDIYVILAKNYLAMLAEDYEYEQQKGHVKDYPTFKGTANVPLSLGWKGIFDVDDDADETDNAKGLGTFAEPFVYEGFPPKPQAPTRKWLMSQLEKHDVGTGATRVSTYADVTSTSARFPLLEEKRGRISMAECGDMAYLLLPDTHIGDIKLTERVQAEMEAVAKGEADPEALLDTIASMIRDDIAVMERNGQSMRDKLGVRLKGAPAFPRVTCMWEGEESSYMGGFCGHEFTDAENKILQSGGKIELTDCVSRAGKTFACKGGLAVSEKYGLGFAPEFEDDGRVGGVFTGRGKHKGENVRFKGEFSGHTFTDEEIADLLAGKTIEFDAVSKKGSPYTAKGKLADNTFNGRKYFGFKLIFD